MKITAAILALATMVIAMPSPHGSDAPKKREEMTVDDISAVLYGAWPGPSKAKREDIKREDVTVDDISAVLYGAWPGPSKAKRDE
ncbi:uncharacterized protein PAC_09405 [Phialocephala subalpina]|uniref:Uncharacterized protein n=1 Tax=Phialocephala subalpina TaxID=576137 RepID=A0A1L7X3A9_9HELO|nr:uncharacterized protein PAC_09405 [Phialocephala subalpina]